MSRNQAPIDRWPADRWKGAGAPSTDDIARLAEQAVAVIPEELRQHLGDIVFRVEDFPDDEVVRSMGLASPFDLLGLYQGISLDEKSAFDTVPGQDMIFLYRRPILDYWCETGEALDHLVRHVLIHEVGHHFGLSDADMEHIEALADAAAGTAG